MKRMATLHKCQAIAYFVQMAAFVAEDKKSVSRGHAICTLLQYLVIERNKT